MILINRIKRAIFLDGKVYSEIAEDKDALVQATIIVLLTTVISGIALWIWYIGLISGSYNTTWLTILFYLILILVPILLMNLAGWFIATGIMHITAKLLGGKADFVSYLKAIGFARAPGVFIVTVIPYIGISLYINISSYIGWIIIGPIWTLACYFTATKVVHGLSTGKAIIAAVIVPIILAVLIIKMNVMAYSWLKSGNDESDFVLAIAIEALIFLSLFSLL